MSLQRWFRHMATGRWQVNRAFPPSRLQAIEQAIRDGEAVHGGEVRFAVEGALDHAALRAGLTPAQRALDVFSLLRIWDTNDRNGVLVYVLLADHAVEIIADRGIHARVGNDGWEAICQQMEAGFRAGDPETAVTTGIRAVNTLLQQHFPDSETRPNELPDVAVIL